MTTLNAQYIDLMDKLATIMSNQGENFRARAYQKAQETIISYPYDIMSPNELKGQPNIGKTILDKLIEYTETGTLSIIEREKTNPVNILSNVYGIGPKSAKELVEKGIHSISSLRENQHLLNDVQKVGLQHYEDVLKRIPRSEIEEYKTLFDNIFPHTFGKFEIVGSYRRGAEHSGDIDVIITSTTERLFIDFIDYLKKVKVICNILSRGTTKCLVMAKIPSSTVVRRVDFLFTTPQEFPFAILYFTGSKIFNTVMRQKALDKGYTMNEHGIYEVTPSGMKIPVTNEFKTEQDIFDFLNLQYKAPQERMDGRAVQDKPQQVHTYLSMQYINDFKQKGISVLEKMTENELTVLLREANDAYFNVEPLMTDSQYDIIKEFIKDKYTANVAVHEVGYAVGDKIHKLKVELPYEMWSMNKINPDTDAVSKWKNDYSGPYAVSCKLDGVSGLYTTEGDVPKLYTRGDGKVGQDISHLISFLHLPAITGISIRGEFIIQKSVFEDKYKGLFSNPRNTVSGIINSKTIGDAIRDVDFVAYEVIMPSMKPSDQLSYLTQIGVKTVRYEIKNTITNDILSKILVTWRNSYEYEMDGIIITNDKIYARMNKNPKHAVAFKMALSDQFAEVKVVDVIWSPSKYGYLKPRVRIEPVHLCGVTITYATGHNAAFIWNNKIGIGSVVKIVRGGEVIPEIVDVIVPSEKPKMPDTSYTWNDTRVDIILDNLEQNEVVNHKLITSFFTSLHVDGLGDGNTKRIISAGYDSISKIVKMNISDFLLVDGFKTKTAEKIYNSIRTKLTDASLVDIMSASNLFGRGLSDKRLQLIMDKYPLMLVSKETKEKKIEQLVQINGIESKLAEAFVERIPLFIDFIREIELEGKLNVSSVKTVSIDQSHPLFNKTVILTGFRNAALQEKIVSVGGKIGTSVSSKTYVVLVKDIYEDTGKANDARKCGVKLMLPEEFIMMYFP
jgi:DNA ligase (NAD+)